MARTKAKHVDRINKSYEEALRGLGEEKLKIYCQSQALELEVLEMISERLIWTRTENERRNREALAKGEPPPSPFHSMAEVEAISQITTAVTQMFHDVVEKGDPTAGAKEIVRVLEEARKKYGKCGKCSDGDS